jgi:cobyrinic acid a,c-diamide synthase
MDGENTDFLISKAKRRSWQGGTSRSWLYAAYPHLYFYGNPEIAINFVRAMEAAKNDD